MLQYMCLEDSHSDSSVCSYRQGDASVRIQVVGFLFELLTFAQQNAHPWLQEEYLHSLLCSLLEKVSWEEALTSAMFVLSFSLRASLREICSAPYIPIRTLPSVSSLRGTSLTVSPTALRLACGRQSLPLSGSSQRYCTC